MAGSGKKFFTNVRGQKLCGVLHDTGDKDNIVILVHGFSSNKNGSTHTSLAPELVKRGIATFRIDLMGRGESEGNFEESTTTKNVEDVEAAVEYVKKLGYRNVSLFGSSAGGLVCMIVALRNPEIKCIALKAPVSKFTAKQFGLEGEDYIRDWKDKGYAVYMEATPPVRINYGFLEDSMQPQYDMFERGRDIKCPVLIIHGDRDENVDLEDSKKLFTVIPDCKLMIIKGADHSLEINGKPAKASRQFADWFKKQLKK